MRIIGDLGEDLDTLVGDWGDQGKRRSGIVTHEDGTTEENLGQVGKSTWRRETCPTSPPLLISTLPSTPESCSPVPPPPPPRFVPGHIMAEPPAPSKVSSASYRAFFIWYV